MKFYIAAYIGEKRRVQEISNLLKKHGHKIIVDWTNGPDLSLKKREGNSNMIKNIAVRDMDGVRNCDVFVILSEPVHGRAKYVEMGAALASFLEKGRPRIYVLGKKTHQSVFYYHPAVKRVTCLDEIISGVAGRKSI